MLLVEAKEETLPPNSGTCPPAFVQKRSRIRSYLHTEAGLGPCEGQNLHFDSLPFVDHIGHVCHAALPAELGDVDQPLPPFAAAKGSVRTEGQKDARSEGSARSP